jgi:hypothetical protein
VTSNYIKVDKGSAVAVLVGRCDGGSVGNTHFTVQSFGGMGEPP